MSKITRIALIAVAIFMILLPLIDTFFKKIKITTIYYLVWGFVMSISLILILLRATGKRSLPYKDTCKSSERTEDIIWVSVDNKLGNPLSKEDIAQKLQDVRAENSPMAHVVAKPKKHD